MIPSLRPVHGMSCEGLVCHACDGSNRVLAVAEETGPRVFFTKAECCDGGDCEKSVILVPEGVSCLRISIDGLFIGTKQGRLLKSLLGSGSSTAIKLGLKHDDNENHPVSFISKNEIDNVVSISCDRWISLLKLQGDHSVQSIIGPLPSSAIGLDWALSSDTKTAKKLSLSALTPHSLHIWPDYSINESEITISSVQLIQAPHKIDQDIQCTLFASSPKTHFIAIAFNIPQICLLPVPSILADPCKHPLPCHILKDYDNPVTCLDWDMNGRYLSTNDGPDCIIWDLHSMQQEGVEASKGPVVCCGHAPGSKITHIAFQPDGPLLATSSDQGHVVIFNSRAFPSGGGVVGPYATTQLGNSKNASSSSISVLQWLSDGCIVVGTAGGTVQCLIVDPVPTSIIKSNGANENSTAETRGADVLQSMQRIAISVEYTSPPHSPIEEPLSISSTVTLDKKEGGSGRMAPGPWSTEESTHMTTNTKKSTLRPIKTSTPPSDTHRDTKHNNDLGALALSPLPLQSIDVTPTSSTSTSSALHAQKKNNHSMYSAANTSPATTSKNTASSTSKNTTSTSKNTADTNNDSATMNLPRQSPQNETMPPPKSSQQASKGNNGNATITAQSKTTTTNSTTTSSHNQMHPQIHANPPHIDAAYTHMIQPGTPLALYHQIQQIRESPAIPRSEQRDNLTGWGLGYPGGAAIPWMGAPAMCTNTSNISMPYGQHSMYAVAPSHHPSSPPPPRQASSQPLPPPAPLSLPSSPAYQHAILPQMPIAIQVPMQLSQGYQVASPSSPAAGNIGGAGGAMLSAYTTPTSPEFGASSAPAVGGGVGGGAPHAPVLHPSHRPTTPIAAGAPPPAAAMYITAAPTHLAISPAGNMMMHHPSYQHSSAGQHMMPAFQHQQYIGVQQQPLLIHQAAQQWAGFAPGYMAYQHQGSAALSASTGSTTNSTANSTVSSPMHLSKGGVARKSMESSPRHTPSNTTSNSNTTTSNNNSTITNNKNNNNNIIIASASPKSASPSKSGDSHHLTNDISPLGSSVHTDTIPATETAALPSSHLHETADTKSAATTVYIGNLLPSVDETFLVQTCGYFGPVSYAQVIRDKTTHISKGYGFVTFGHSAHAALAMQQLNGQVLYGPFGGKRIKVSSTSMK